MGITITEKFRSAPPRGGIWKYEHPISGRKFSSPQLPAIKQSIWKHEEGNGYPRSTDQQIEDQLCINHPFSCGDESPGFVEKASHFASAMVDWAKSGFAVASEEVLQQRLDICQACQHWRGTRGGTLLTGRCNKCGCSGLKLGLASEACPIGKWSSVT